MKQFLWALEENYRSQLNTNTHIVYTDAALILFAQFRKFHDFHLSRNTPKNTLSREPGREQYKTNQEALEKYLKVKYINK